MCGPQFPVASSRASRTPCLAVKKRESHVTKRSDDPLRIRNIVCCALLTFALRRFVVDVDAQVVAIRDLKHDPCFSYRSTEIIPRQKPKERETGSVHQIPGLLAFGTTLTLHVLLPHPQSLYTVNQKTLHANQRRVPLSRMGVIGNRQKV